MEASGQLAAEIERNVTAALAEDIGSGELALYRIVGPDETDAQRGWISIDAPLARAMLKKRVDDEFEAQLPGGMVRFVIVGVRYESL